MQRLVVIADPIRCHTVGLLAVRECAQEQPRKQLPPWTDFDERRPWRGKLSSVWPQCLDALERELRQEKERDEKNSGRFHTPLRAIKQLSPLTFFSPL